MPEQQLFLDTPLSRAVFKFFDRVANDLLEANYNPGAVRAYLFGGCALHIHTNARGSGDIDVEFSCARYVKEEEIIIDSAPVTYINNKGARMALSLDKTFTPSLAPLHEDYQEDAIQLERRKSQSPLWLYVVTPADLAVSKLGRFGEQDIKDILTLLRMKKMSIDEFCERARDAIDYYPGNSSALLGSVDIIVRQFGHIGIK